MKGLFVTEISSVKGNPKVLKKAQKKTESFSEILKNLKKLRNSAENLSMKEEALKTAEHKAVPTKKDVKTDVRVVKEKVISEELKSEKKAPEIPQSEKEALKASPQRGGVKAAEDLKDTTSDKVSVRASNTENGKVVQPPKKLPDEENSKKEEIVNFPKASKFEHEKAPGKEVSKSLDAAAKEEESEPQKANFKTKKGKILNQKLTGTPAHEKNSSEKVQALKRSDSLSSVSPKRSFESLSKVEKDKAEKNLEREFVKPAQRIDIEKDAKVEEKRVGKEPEKKALDHYLEKEPNKEEILAKGKRTVISKETKHSAGDGEPLKTDGKNKKDPQGLSKGLNSKTSEKFPARDDKPLKAEVENGKNLVKENGQRVDLKGQNVDLREDSKIKGRDVSGNIHRGKSFEKRADYPKNDKGPEEKIFRKPEEKRSFEKLPEEKISREKIFDGREKAVFGKEGVKGLQKAAGFSGRVLLKDPSVREKLSKEISKHEERKEGRNVIKEKILKPDVVKGFEKSEKMIREENVHEISGREAEKIEDVSRREVFHASGKMNGNKKTAVKDRFPDKRRVAAGIGKYLKSSKTSEFQPETGNLERQLSEKVVLKREIPSSGLMQEVKKPSKVSKDSELISQHIGKALLKGIEKKPREKTGDRIGDHAEKEVLRYQNFGNIDGSFEKSEDVQNYKESTQKVKDHPKKPIEKVLSKKLMGKDSAEKKELLEEISRVSEGKIDLPKSERASEGKAFKFEKTEARKSESGGDPKSDVKPDVMESPVNLTGLLSRTSENGGLKLDEILKDTRKSVDISRNLEDQSKESVDIKTDDKRKVLLENVRIEITVSKKVKDAYQSYEYDHRKFKDIFRKIQQVKDEINLMRFSENSHKSEGARNVPTSPVSERVRIDEIIERISKILESRKSQPKFVERAKMDLEPPDLGKLEVEISKEDKSVALIFKVSSHRAKDIIEKKLDTLVHRLSNDGFNVEKIEVRVEKEERQGEDLTDHQENRGQREKDENEKREKREEGEENDGQ